MVNVDPQNGSVLNKITINRINIYQEHKQQQNTEFTTESSVMCIRINYA